MFTKYVNTLPPEDVKLLKSAFLIAGIYDLEPLLSTSYNNPLKLTAETAKLYSPIHHRIADCDTKFFIVVGENDSPAFVTQSRIIKERFESQNMAARLMVLENVDHMDIVEKIVNEDFKLTQLMLNSIQKY